MCLLGGFGRSARTRGWAVLDGLRSKDLSRTMILYAYILLQYNDMTYICVSWFLFKFSAPFSVAKNRYPWRLKCTSGSSFSDKTQ